MIGKPQWFQRRKYGGWGLTPKTWQGWVYVAVLAGALGFTMSASISSTAKPAALAIIFAVAIADMIHIMLQLPKVHDERENYHQLLIERNCSFAAMGAMLAIVVYELFKSGRLMATGNQGVQAIMANPALATVIIVMAAMFVTKVASTLYVKSKI